MSILPLLLLVGVASSKYISSHGNDDRLQPIVTSSQARRICATLCMSGLGGEACSDGCLDIIPDSMPLQLVNDTTSGTTTSAGKPRTDACPVLCVNQLGYPLCTCEEHTPTTNSAVDYVQICGYFCLKLGYHINGCQNCEVYKKAAEMYGSEAFSVDKSESLKRTIDWEAWCKQMCLIGDGGAACNCDILPMMANITV